MKNPFGFLKQTLAPSYLGVDIGTTSIKLIEVKGGKHLPEVTNYAFLQSSGHLVRSNDVLQTSNMKLFDEEVVSLLKIALQKMKPSAKQVLASLPSFAVFTTVFEFPQMSDSELQKSLAYQARQYIPQPITEVVLDSMKVGEREDDKGFKYEQVLLISVPKDLVKKYQRIFHAVGLELKTLEIETLSLVRALVSGDATPTVIVDIGSRSTNIIFSQGGQLRFSSQSDYAGASLTQALASSLNINPLRADELKKEHGIVNIGPNYELSTIMLPYVDVIISEVKKAEYNYQSQFPGVSKMERVILTGGGANLSGIFPYFEKELGVPVVKAAPFLKFEYPGSIEPFLGEINPIFSTALGLTMREFQ